MLILKIQYYRLSSRFQRLFNVSHSVIELTTPFYSILDETEDHTAAYLTALSCHNIHDISFLEANVMFCLGNYSLYYGAIDIILFSIQHQLTRYVYDHMLTSFR